MSRGLDMAEIIRVVEPDPRGPRLPAHQLCDYLAMVPEGLSTALVVILAAIGAAAAGATALSRPCLCLAILFLVASFSRATLETPLGTMRPEMPAIAVVAVLLLANGRFRGLLDLPRSTLVMALAFGTFLGVMALSSAVAAPGRSQSVHMVAWYAISMFAGVEAFILIRPQPADSVEPFAFAGATMGALGILAAAAFLIAGPGFYLGIQEQTSVQPRVYAVAWETNLYASFLAMCAFFALEAARRRSRFGVAMLALVLVGFPLGITRGAYIGLAAGALAYVATLVTIDRHAVDFRRLGALSAPLLAVGILASMTTLPNLLERAPGSNPAASGGPASGQSGSPGPVATPAPTLAPSSDTLEFRLERVRVALGEVPQSPIIGFGAEAFGQRHPRRYAGSGADHIAVMGVEVLYQSGIAGLAALTVGFAMLLFALWQSARRSFSRMDGRSVAAAAAFIGALVAMLVAYQVTTSVQFAINWIIVGAATALTVGVRPEEPTASPG
jgi:hypothetical protein